MSPFPDVGDERDLPEPTAEEKLRRLKLGVAAVVAIVGFVLVYQAGQHDAETTSQTPVSVAADSPTETVADFPTDNEAPAIPDAPTDSDSGYYEPAAFVKVAMQYAWDDQDLDQQATLCEKFAADHISLDQQFADIMADGSDGSSVFHYRLTDIDNFFEGVCP